MHIGEDAQEASASLEWHVRVSVSVIKLVPRDLLSAWMACEAFQRGNDHFWPDNRALAVWMQVGPVTSVRRLLGRLEDLGVLERRRGPGGRRVIALLRRTSEAMTAAEWTGREIAAEERSRKLTGQRLTGEPPGGLFKEPPLPL